MNITKPMLASPCTDIHKLNFPVLATPKLDGFRSLKLNGKAVTRSLKPVPNLFARAWIEADLPNGVDGELMLRDGTFNETASAIGQRGGEPDFIFCIFDYVCMFDDNLTYEQRVSDLECLEVNENRVRKVLPYKCHNVAELEVYETEMLAQGYEGVMVRDPKGPYKCGRSTEREGWLLKIKRFEDSEATVLDTYEGMTNTNEAFTDALGHTKRSTAQAGKVGRGELGGFVVRALATGVEFRLGYNHITGGVARATLWQQRSSLVGKVVKYKHQPSGAKDAPRFPQFIGFRAAWDM